MMFQQLKMKKLQARYMHDAVSCSYPISIRLVPTNMWLLFYIAGWHHGKFNIWNMHTLGMDVNVILCIMYLLFQWVKR